MQDLKNFWISKQLKSFPLISQTHKSPYCVITIKLGNSKNYFRFRRIFSFFFYKKKELENRPLAAFSRRISEVEGIQPAKVSLIFVIYCMIQGQIKTVWTTGHKLAVWICIFRTKYKKKYSLVLKKNYQILKELK